MTGPAEDTGLAGCVLAGQFFGAGHEGPARLLAHFLAEGDGAACLSSWLGGGLTACLCAADPAAVVRARLDRDIAAIDALVQRQLETVLAHPRLQRLESSWRGLHWLAQRVPFGARVQLRLLPLRWTELCRDLQRATEFDQSQMFRLIYEQEFGHPGGEPYGLLLLDHALRPAPVPESPTDDLAAMDALAGIAAAAFAPLAVAAHPALLGLEDFADAGASLDLVDVLRRSERAGWRHLRRREDARFVAMLLPRVLARAPWADDNTRADGFRPHRRIGPRVWMSPVFALGATVIRAFTQSGWPADIRGAPVDGRAQGGVVDALPAERLSGDPPGPTPRPPVELALTDQQERQLVEAGLVPLLGLPLLPEVAFGALPSLHQPPRMTAEAADANQALSAQFNAILCVSRFAHCVKVMGRDMVGAFRTADEIQRRLQRWIAGFVNTAGSGLGENAARYPLRDARVEVRERPGRPGVFACTVLLQPHYQLDAVGAAFRLVTDIQAARAA